VSARLLALAVALVAGCGAHAAPPPGSAFRFATDTFAFPNETVWEYRPDPVTKTMEWWKRPERPPFALRCGSVARAARQFRLHARFLPDRPEADAEAYRRMIDAVLATDPRRKTPLPVPIDVPGYADLRSFSAAHAGLLKDALDEPGPSYAQRGNWRMIFPFTARHQRAEAERLAAELARGELPVVHVLRFPALTLNHLVLVYAVERTAAELRFSIYDPNEAEKPLALVYDRGARVFVFPQTPYYPGGPVRVYEVYDAIIR
jgi:hypothetical protein